MKKLFALALLLCLLLSACTSIGTLDNPVNPNVTAAFDTTVNEITEPFDFINTEIEKYASIINAYQDFTSDSKTISEGDASAIEMLYSKIVDIINIDETDIEQERILYEIWCSCAEISFGDANYYTIYDLNNDGIPELIIFSNYSDILYVPAIYSLYNDTPILVGAFWPRKSCAFDETGTIYIHSSGGIANNSSASYSITPGSSELQLIEEVGIESSDRETGEYFSPSRCYLIKDGEKTILGYDNGVLYESELKRFPVDSSNDLFKEAVKNMGIVFISLS